MKQTILSKKLTNADKYVKACDITDPLEARVYFEALVEHAMVHGKLTRKQAEKQERQNIGYFAGYYTIETRERVSHLYDAEHPILALLDSPAEAFEKGYKLGLKQKKTR